MSSRTVRTAGGLINRRSVIARAAAVAAVGAALAQPASVAADRGHDCDDDDDRKRPPEAREEALSANRPIGEFVHVHDWGLRQGEWLLTITHTAINHVSSVFVSASEGPPAARVIGDARITV